ncbi:MAG: hypothetical protein KZQ90_20840, partial [Candidatus Thiodiazotropha sp. (ex Codakia rugifera)]|nr:hypothetical protein [Candidatus Thiodiazotropha sp. (ex Codakia rugifera)]
LEADQVHAIRATVQTGTPLGNTRFCVQIEKQLKCKVSQARRGRPKGRKKKQQEKKGTDPFFLPVDLYALHRTQSGSGGYGTKNH